MAQEQSDTIAQTYKVAILGYGFTGKLHKEVIESRIPRLRVVAVVDKNPEAYGNLGTEARYVVAPSYEALLKQRNVGDVNFNAVIIALPTHIHEEATAACAENGIPMLLEKPIAEDFETARRIYDKITETGAKCMVGMTGRFHPEFSSAYDACREVTGIANMQERIHFGGPALDTDAFRNSYLNGKRGIGLENGIHTFDRIQWFAGSEIVSIEGLQKGSTLRGLAEDNMSGVAVLGNSMKVPFSWRWNGHEEEDYAFQVLGSRLINVEGFRKSEVVIGNKRTVLYEHDLSQNMRERHKPGFAAELGVFTEFLGEQRQTLFLDSALNAQRAVELLYQ